MLYLSYESLKYAFNYIERNRMSMDGWQFEHYVADILRQNGYYDVEVTKGSGDFGVDIVALKDEVKFAIQCKHYNSQVGVEAIQQVYSGKAFYDCDRAIVITQSGFTPAAEEMATKLDVELWDGRYLSRLKKRDRIDIPRLTFDVLYDSESSLGTDSNLDLVC